MILAEGLPVESYLDTGDRMNFDGNGTIRLHPDLAARQASNAARLWETNGAAPLVLAGAPLAEARAVVAAKHEPSWLPSRNKGISGGSLSHTIDAVTYRDRGTSRSEPM